MNHKQEFRNIYPPEVIELMLKRQQEQGNPKDIKPFLDDIRVSRGSGGFTWSETIEGDEFWERVLIDLNFDVFYKAYPKIDKLIDTCQKIEKLISHLEK